MTISYRLDGAGWATATIEHNGRHRTMRVSYLSDAVKGMLDAAIGLIRGAETVRFGFTDEPGEHDCILTRIDQGKIRIQVFWYKEWTPPGPNTGDEVFICECSVLQFCEVVFKLCKQLVDEHGEDGYKQLWVEHEFPIETFECLSHLLYPPRKGVSWKFPTKRDNEKL